jgi:ABC-type nickel/cobalt efflux system permease component RcnA
LATPAEGRAATSPLSRFIEPGALTLSTVVLLLAVALGLGAVHALEPGHGKSIVAAYFVGTRGSAAQAALLGLIVAVTHSLGVLAVAALVLFGSQYFVPEDAYPWLTMLSGGMVLLLGMALLISRTRSSGLWHRLQHLRRHGHHHEHDSDHHHHSPPQHTPERPPWKTLVLLGLVDGLIPTPSTLVVLLGAISIGRVELGLLMVVAFSTGMAVVMASISLAILGLRAVAGRLSGSLGGRQRRGARWVQRAAAGLPLGAAVVLLVIGTTIVLRGASGLSLL